MRYMAAWLTSRCSMALTGQGGGVMKSLASFFAVALIVATAPRISSQPVLALPQVWGPSTNGLRIGISSVSSSNLTAAGAQFSVALQNTGDSDFVVNLGHMLANGKVMLPEAIRFTLTDPAGKSRELRYFSARRYPVVAGRVDDFTVALQSGSIYVLRVSLNQYWGPATKEFEWKLAEGRHRITARFEGQGAQSANLDMQGIALLNFWKGTVQSNVVEFEVSRQVAPR
jgi:hypothetical protein